MTVGPDRSAVVPSSEAAPQRATGGHPAAASVAADEITVHPLTHVVVAVLLLGMMAAVVYHAWEFPGAARTLPWLIGWPTVAAAAANVGLAVRNYRRAAPAVSGQSSPGDGRRVLVAFGWLGVLGLLYFSLGQDLGSAAFLMAFLRLYGKERWAVVLGITVITVLVMRFGFAELLGVSVFRGILFS